MDKNKTIVMIFPYKMTEIHPGYETVLTCADIFLKVHQLNIPLDIEINAEGKPDFIHPDIYFSVSHSHNLWICTISNTKIGIDIEKKIERTKEKISEKIFHPYEYNFLKENHFESFYDIWCAKESYVKYTGKGIDSSFSSFYIKDNIVYEEDSQVAIITPILLDEEYITVICTKEKPEINIYNKKHSYETIYTH